ncbi:MAG: hypothetical protein P8R42_08855 [Candidatus Binatia bacterium]|nr:hypothetical protein [Candidatus Binatia bacterium]
MANVFPAEFADLEPYAAWAVQGETARYEKRVASTMEELQEFYDVAFTRIDEALEYLERFEVSALSEEGKRLLWLYCALTTVAFPVEAWRQPRVPDSGPSSINAVVEPPV